MVSIIILALVALFVGLRLYSVLGERTGHEQQPILKPAEQEARQHVRPATSQLTPATAVEAQDNAYLPTAGPGVRALLAADPAFDVARFLEGAQAAYRMILEAFWSGKLDEVRSFIDPEVYATFAHAVQERETAGHRLDNRLVAIDQAIITDATLERTVSTIAVRFEADIAAVTRNAEQEVVAGSLSDAVQTRDRWTFRRDTASRDPNWILIETDEDE